MKQVLITGCSSPDSWYADKIGCRFVVEEVSINYYVFVKDNRLGIKAQDCHIIEPWCEVAKQAEEQGREVQFWSDNDLIWRNKYSDDWNSNTIYRLKPIPKPKRTIL